MTWIGTEYGAVGTSIAERQLQNGSMAISNYSGRYYEAARSGKAFNVVFGVTGTGLAIAAIGTSNGAAIYNPTTSGVNISITEVRLGMVSSTLILGTILHGVNTNTSASATTGTANTAVAALAGSSATSGARPLYTVTLPANPTPARVFVYKQPTIATGNSFILSDLVDGAITLAPGATWSLYVIAADTSPLWQISASWIEETV